MLDAVRQRLSQEEQRVVEFVNRLSATEQASHSQIEELQESIRQAEHRFEEKSMLLEVATKTELELTAALKDRDFDIETLRSQLTENRSALDSLESSCSVLETHLGQKDDELGRRQVLLEQSEEKIAQYKIELTDLQKSVIQS